MQTSNSSTKRGLLSEFRAIWQSGNDVDVHTFLARYPGIDGKSVIVDLAYEEFCLRHERGESPTADEFCERFPDVRCSLRRALEVHSYLGDLWNKSAVTHELLSEVEWPVDGSRSHGFKIIRQLGHGGLARVYLAQEPRLGDRLVAVKFSLFGGYEAETIGKLVHPNIVTAHSVQEDEAGVTAICMPYYGAATLSNVLDMVLYCDALPTKASLILETVRETEPPEGLQDWQEPDPVFNNGSYVDGVVHIAIELTRALSYAHQQGVIHGDVKPSNVLVTPSGRSMLLDFNLSLDDCVEQGRIGGTLAYMAPEQIHSVFLTTDDVKLKAQIDERSDIFSLAVMIYQLLTGKLPFGDTSVDEQLQQAAKDALAARSDGVAPLGEMNASVPPEISAVIHSCLDPQSENRPRTAQELLRSLEKYPRRTNLRRRAFAAATGVGLLGLAAGAYAFYSQDPLETGIALVRNGKYERAVSVLTQLAESDSRQADILFARATAYRLLGQYERAIKDYRDVKYIQPLAVDAVDFPLGYCYILIGRMHTAADVLCDPDSRPLPPAWRQNHWYALARAGHSTPVIIGVKYYVNGTSLVFHHIRLIAYLEGPQRVDMQGRAQVHAEDAIRAAVDSQLGYGTLYFDAARVFARGQGLYPSEVRDSITRAVELGVQGRELTERDFDPYREESWFRELMSVEHDGEPPTRLEQLTVRPSPNPRLATLIENWQL